MDWARLVGPGLGWARLGLGGLGLGQACVELGWAGLSLDQVWAYISNP